MRGPRPEHGPPRQEPRLGGHLVPRQRGGRRHHLQRHVRLDPRLRPHARHPVRGRRPPGHQRHPLRDVRQSAAGRAACQGHERQAAVRDDRVLPRHGELQRQLQEVLGHRPPLRRPPGRLDLGLRRPGPELAHPGPQTPDRVRPGHPARRDHRARRHLRPCQGRFRRHRLPPRPPPRPHRLPHAGGLGHPARDRLPPAHHRQGRHPVRPQTVRQNPGVLHPRRRPVGHRELGAARRLDGQGAPRRRRLRRGRGDAHPVRRRIGARHPHDQPAPQRQHGVPGARHRRRQPDPGVQRHHPARSRVRPPAERGGAGLGRPRPGRRRCAVLVRRRHRQAHREAPAREDLLRLRRRLGRQPQRRCLLRGRHRHRRPRPHGQGRRGQADLPGDQRRTGPGRPRCRQAHQRVPVHQPPRVRRPLVPPRRRQGRPARPADP